MREIDWLDFGRGRRTFVNVAVMLHGVDDDELAFFRHEEVDIGRVERGRVRQAGQHGRFGQLECRRLFAKVAFGGWAYAVVVRTIVDGVEVKLKDFVFAVISFDVECQQQFFSLAPIGLFVGEEKIFDQLLVRTSHPLR